MELSLCYYNDLMTNQPTNQPTYMAKGVGKALLPFLTYTYWNSPSKKEKKKGGGETNYVLDN